MIVNRMTIESNANANYTCSREWLNNNDNEMFMDRY